MNYIGEFEKTLAEEAHRHAADCVICGHIHHAVIHDNFGVRYVNCGDWVETCSAIGEHADGRLELLLWTDAMHEQEPADVPSDEDETEIAA